MRYTGFFCRLGRKGGVVGSLLPFTPSGITDHDCK